jgi:hypothetical protein
VFWEPAMLLKCRQSSLLYISARNECLTYAWNMRALGYPGKGRDRKSVLRASSGDSVGIAKATKDPKISAALMDKAADLRSKVDELGAPLDLTPLAPDIEPPPAK